MSRGQRILVCGMPRSLTTWTFNAVRLLLRDPPKTLWIEPDSAEEQQFADGDEATVLGKCHHYSDVLRDAATIILYSYRDIRMAAISARRKFGSSYSSGQLDSWVENGRRWLPVAHLVSRYETDVADLEAAVGRLRKVLEQGGVPLGSLSDADVAAGVEHEFAEAARDPKVTYDSQTMILPQHRTYSPEPDALPPEERAIFDRASAEQAAWLRDFGYESAETYGQDVEYRVSEMLIGRLCKDPVVVDVGSERGSFSWLALDAGASSVVGFEPLPRHLQFLRNAFRLQRRARFLPFALSDSDGHAVLHVATDIEGHELDYHHTLSDLGDSATVVRSRKSIDVETATLASLVERKELPARIDFLKIDTDGHDLAVLEGLGDIRPRIVMAEYWDHLYETSGVSPYLLADLGEWARTHGYDKLIVVRRNGRLQTLERNVAHSVQGDWGNVFMLRADVDMSPIEPDLEERSRLLHESNLQYVHGLVKDVELKEHEIRRLDAALQSARQMAAGPGGGTTSDLEAKEAVIQQLKTANDHAQARVTLHATEMRASQQFIATLEARADVTESILRELKAAFAGRESQLEQMRGAIEHRTREIEQLHRRIEAANASLEDTRSQERSLRNELLSERDRAGHLGRVIEQQVAQLGDVGQLRERLAAAEARANGLSGQLAERDEAMKSLQHAVAAGTVASAAQTNLALLKSIEEKESVIRELAQAVNAYRGALRALNLPLRSAMKVKSVMGGARSRLKTMSQPRLGRLHQYAPRPMAIPSFYRSLARLHATPKVSIVTPSFRQAHFIVRTIDSVLGQDYPNLEYYVQDGGSTDGTVEVLEKYADRLAGWESKPDGGQSQAINLGFARTTGDIMAWVNSDDVLLPGAINCVVDYFNRHPDVDVVYGDRLLIDENDAEIGRWVMPPHDDGVLSWADYVPQETMFWRRRIWDRVEARIDESFRFAMDWDLLVRFRDAGAKFAHIRRFLGAFRVHEAQKTSAVINEVGHREMNRIRERALGRVPDPREISEAVRPYLVRHVMRHTMHRLKSKLGAE